jgi:hypothetical protein
MKNGITLGKLRAITERLLMDGVSPDAPVLVSTEDGSIGPRGFSAVCAMNPGFDWETGQVRIETIDPLVKKK